jgi:hypothetical protein
LAIRSSIFGELEVASTLIVTGFCLPCYLLFVCSHSVYCFQFYYIDFIFSCLAEAAEDFFKPVSECCSALRAKLIALHESDLAAKLADADEDAAGRALEDAMGDMLLIHKESAFVLQCQGRVDKWKNAAATAELSQREDQARAHFVLIREQMPAQPASELHSSSLESCDA